MNRRAKLASHIALAACSFALQVNAEGFASVQLTPAGKFYPADGRSMSVDGWKIDAASAQRVIEKFNQRKTPVVMDYEHQTLHKEDNGQPAPAAGWFRGMEWQEGKGLFATIELTARAKEAVANKEYLYFSPVFHYDANTGEVKEVVMGALTNTPAVDGMDELTLRAAACFGAHLEDNPVDLLQQLLAKLNLKEGTTEEEALAALNQKLDATPLVKIRSALGVSEDADTNTLVATCTALKAKSESGEPDPSKFVPVSAVNEMRTEIAALSQKLKAQEEKDVNGLIESALNDGRLVKSMEGWARDLAKTNVAALTSYLSTVPPLAALSGSQTRGEAPVNDDTGLTDDELAVCTNMGITVEAFKKARGDKPAKAS